MKKIHQGKIFINIARQKKIFKVLFFIWLSCLLALLYAPRLPQVRIDFLAGWVRLDYLAHFGFNAILIYLFLLWRSDHRYRIEPRRGLHIFAAGMLFCLFTEYTQHLVVPMRAFEYQDLISNALGMICGAIAFVALPPLRIINRLLRRRKPKPHTK